jgi:uncharacterized protein (UPF0332 family)
MAPATSLPPPAAGLLDKATENLEDAQAALAAARHNACASRSYYAAFQAAVAALWVEGIRPQPGTEGTLSHKMVQVEWSGRLIYRRKLYPPELQRTLQGLVQLRLKADYRPDGVTRREASRVVAASELLVRHVQARLLPPGT